MNEQTSNPNAINEGTNEQAAVSSLPARPEPSLKSSRRYSLRFRRKRTRRRQTNVNKSSMSRLGLGADQISAGRT